MAIHNLMEELAASVLDEVCKEDQAGSGRYCVSEQCRTDALCYILNRISPRYISSGRGFAHLTEELQEDQQLMIDVMRLVHEGLQRVSAVRRTFYDTESKDALQGACFNFPTIKGRLLDGAGFLPVSDVDVQLFLDGESVEMFDTRWSNPYHVSPQTPGTFIFWPAPISIEEMGTQRKFEFELRVEESEFDPLNHLFTLELTSESGADEVFNLERDHKLPDLYLFHR